MIFSVPHKSPLHKFVESRPFIMYKCIGFTFLTCLLQIYAQEGYKQPKNFSALVVEYNPASSTEQNIEQYEFSISKSAQNFKGDIIVFPERTLTVSTKDASIVPDPKDKVIPHKNGTFDKNSPMFRISVAAARHNLYVVINLFEMVKCTNNSNCPDRGFFLYDTNVVFDRRGMLVARYRKYNVYSGNQVDKPDKPDLSTFKSDFGVTFGMFTGFDILFETPAVDLVQQKKVKYFVFPSRWPGELPFLTGIQVQDGWSYAMNVTLLASGANNMETGCSGSGIYVARKGKNSRLSEKNGWDMIHYTIPTETMKTAFLSSQPNGRGLKLLEDPSIPQSRGMDLNVDAGKFKEKICYKGICCNFDLKYKKIQLSNDGKYKYRAIAFQGVRKFGVNLKHEVEYCAVVLCTDGNCAKKPEDGLYPLEFEDVKIDAQFKKNTLQFPSTLIWASNPGDFKLTTMPYNTFAFEKNDVPGTDLANVEMSFKLKGVKCLVTFSIFGRKFN